MSCLVIVITVVFVYLFFSSFFYFLIIDENTNKKLEKKKRNLKEKCVIFSGVPPTPPLPLTSLSSDEACLQLILENVFHY